MSSSGKKNNGVVDIEQKDSLKQLEKLLAKDARSSGGESNRFLSRLVLTGIMIRLAVFVVLVVILYLVGIIDDLRLVVVGAVIFGGMEGFRLWKLLEYRRSNQPEKSRKKGG